MYPAERRPAVITAQMQAARITRAVASERQLEEVMVDFWFNHFNVYAQKGAVLDLPAYERDAIRPHALGRVPRPAARHRAAPRDAVLPGQLAQHARRPGACPRGPQGRAGASGLNENYARELMELHTLGVDGGYTQQDVIEVARAFTGWTHRPAAARAARFVFRPAGARRGSQERARAR